MADSNIQMRSLNGEMLYPKTIMDNVIGLNDKLEDMSEELTDKMKELDEEVKKELIGKIITARDSILGGNNINIDSFTGWKNREGVTYYTNEEETKTRLTNLTIYKNINNKMVVVEYAYGEIIEASRHQCECNPGCGQHVLQITGAITGVFFKVPIEEKKVISANEFEGSTTTKDGKAGVVPKPTKNDANKVLSSNGTWIPGITFDII